MQKALLWKILVIGLVALLLQVPVGMIRGLVGERQQTRESLHTTPPPRLGADFPVLGPRLFFL